MSFNRAPTGLTMSTEKMSLQRPYMMVEPIEEFPLQHGVEYQFTVMASNKVGNSSQSNAVTYMLILPSDAYTTTAPSVTISSNNHSSIPNYIAVAIIFGVFITLPGLALCVILPSVYLFKRSEFGEAHVDICCLLAFPYFLLVNAVNSAWQSLYRNTWKITRMIHLYIVYVYIQEEPLLSRRGSFHDTFLNSEYQDQLLQHLCKTACHALWCFKLFHSPYSNSLYVPRRLSLPRRFKARNVVPGVAPNVSKESIEFLQLKQQYSPEHLFPDSTVTVQNALPEVESSPCSSTSSYIEPHMVQISPGRSSTSKSLTNNPSEYLLSSAAMEQLLTEKQSSESSPSKSCSMVNGTPLKAVSSYDLSK